MWHVEWYHVCWPRLTAKRVEPVVSIGWASCFYRQNAATKRQTDGIKFTHRPKIRFFAPQGRLVTLIQVKLGRADGYIGPLTCAKFRLNRHSGVGMRSQNIKNFYFLVKGRRAGATRLTDFEKIYGLLYAQLSCISDSNLTWFASQVTELLLRKRSSVNYAEFFRAPCSK